MVVLQYLFRLSRVFVLVQGVSIGKKSDRSVMDPPGTNMRAAALAATMLLSTHLP